MSINEHILLFTLLFSVYAFCGKLIVKSGKAFWLVSAIPILLYVFVIGSRYGWGGDYILYKNLYEGDLSNLDNAQNQFIFMWLNNFLNVIGFNYVGAFMAYAFIFITCAFVLLRSHGETSAYMFCFIVPATLFAATYTIRQGVGFSFIFLALVFLYQKKWVPMVFVTLIAYYIHSSTLLTFAMLLGIYFVFKKPIHYFISIPLYIFFTFIFDTRKIGFLSGFLSRYVKLDSSFQGYIDDGDIWFGTEAMRLEATQSTFALIMTSLFSISLFYLGYLALKTRENKQVIFMYNAAILGAILARVVFYYGILGRLVDPLEKFYFIPLGYILYVYYQDCKLPQNNHAILLKKIFPAGIAIILAYLIMFWGRFVFLNPEADFFWYH